MVYSKKLYLILEHFLFGFLIALFLLLVFLVDFFTDNKFTVIQLYGIPVILAALFYGASGVINVSLISSALIAVGLYYHPEGDLAAKAISLGMFGFLVLFANSLAKIKANLDLKSKSLGVKSEVLNLHIAQLRVINQLGHKLIGSTALEDITNLALKATIKLLKVDKASIIIDGSSEIESYVAQAGFHNLDKPGEHLQEFWKKHKDKLLKNKKDATLYLDKIDEKLRVQSIIGAPISSENQIIGLIAGYSSSGRKFNTSEIAFLNVLAEEVGIAIINSCLHENLTKRALMLEGLVDISKTLSSSFRLDKIYKKIVDIAATAVGVDNCKVIIASEETHEVLIAASKIDDNEKNKKVILDNNSIVFKAMEKKKLISSDDFTNDIKGEEAQFIIRPRAKSILVVPIIFEGRSIGAIYFDSMKSGFSFSSQDKILAKAIADQAALFINRAMVYDELKQTARTSSILAESGALLIKSISLDDRLHILTQRLKEVLNVSKVAILLDYEKDQGLSEKDYNKLKNKIMDTSGMVIDKKSGEIEQKWLSTLGAENIYVLPIWYQRSCQGIATFYEPGTYVDFNERQTDLARHIVDYSAVAILTAKLYESVEKLRAESEEKASSLKVLFNVAQTISSSLKTKTVLARAVNSVKQMFNAEIAVLMLYDELSDELAVKINIGMKDQDNKNFTIKPPNDLAGYVFSSKRAAIISYDEPSCEDSIMSSRQGELLSAVAVPLITMGEKIGVVSLYSKKEKAFSNNDLELLQILASQIALSIEIASKYEKEHHIVETLQRSLLPKTPKLEGLEVSVLYSPAHHQSEIGGDYYDFINFDNGSIGVTVGDVCGKGIDAATETAMARYYLQAFASRFKDPATVISYVNKTVTQNYGTLVTMVYLLIDIEKRTLRYTNAGHPPAFILSPDKNIKFLRTTGPMVGALEKAQFRSKELQINKGDTLFLYTDGLTEAQRYGKLFGEERLIALLEELNGFPMKTLVNRVYKSVMKWGNNVINDDIALVGLKINK